MDFQEAFQKAAAALNIKLPPKLPAAASKGWAAGAAQKATSMGFKPKAVSVGTEAAKTVLGSADYDYVVREAFKEELSKLAYAPSMVEVLWKLAEALKEGAAPILSPAAVGKGNPVARMALSSMNPFAKKAPSAVAGAVPGTLGGKSLLGGGIARSIEGQGGSSRLFSALHSGNPAATVR